MKKEFTTTIDLLRNQVNKQMLVTLSNDERVLITFNEHEEVIGMEENCPHDDVPLFNRVDVKNGGIICKRHFCIFCQKTGTLKIKKEQCKGLKIYPIEVLDNNIYVIRN